MLSLLLFPLFLLSLLAPPLDEGAARIVVTGLASDQGHVRVALFDSEDAFTRTAVQAAALPINGGRAVWTLSDLPAGYYAVAAFHDADGDGEMARGLFGLPREPYGFSRGARGRFGPPQWTDARFAVGAERVVVQVPIR